MAENDLIFDCLSSGFWILTPGSLILNSAIRNPKSAILPFALCPMLFAFDSIGKAL